MVTPPVALAAYAGAAIAKGNVMKSAFAAFRFALTGFALPFAFVLRPELLMLTVDNVAANPFLIAAHVLVTLVGITGLAAAIAGYAFNGLGWLIRGVLLLASLSVFFTSWDGIQFWIQLVAVAIVASLLVMNFKRESLKS